jgi:hypothetical protein
VDVQKASNQKNVQITAGESFNVPINTHNCVTSQSVRVISTVEL